MIIKLFFKNKIFRESVFAYIRSKIVSLIRIPMDILDDIQMIIETPDPWERHVKRSIKREQQAEELKQIQRRIILSGALASIVHMNIDAMVFMEPEGVRDYSEEEVRQDFQDHKINLLECMNLLKNEGIHVPKNLVEKVEKYNIDSFSNLQEVNDFGKKLLNEVGNLK